MKKIIFFCFLIFTFKNGTMLHIPHVSNTESLESIFIDTSPKELIKNELAEQCLTIWLCTCRHPRYLPIAHWDKGIKKYQCPIPTCHKLYLNRDNLALHVLVTHSKKRTYACPIPRCLARFKDSKGTTSHLNTVHKVGKHRKEPRRKSLSLICTDVSDAHFFPMSL